VKVALDVANPQDLSAVDERTIERLRATFVAQEKTRRQEEEKVRKANKGKNRAAAEKLREAIKQDKEYTMDTSGALVVLSPIRPNEMRSVQPIVRAKVNDSIVLNTPINTSGLPSATHRKAESAVSKMPQGIENAIAEALAAADAQPNRTSANATKREERVGLEGSEGLFLADLSNIEPECGVSLRYGENVPKKGPSFQENPKFMSRTAFGFNVRNRRTSQLPPTKRAISQLGHAKNVSQVQDELPEVDTTTPVRPQDLLANVRVGFNDGIGLPAIERSLGVVPTTAQSYIRRPGPQRAGTPVKTRVIVGKEALDKSMAYIEENVASRVRTATQRDGIIHRRSIVAWF
jgi:hypothetical protein